MAFDPRNPNLSWWTSLEATDPEHVKPITGKSYGGNSPKPHYVVKRLTDRFGPIGFGWGYEVLSDELLDAGPMLADGKEIGRAYTHHCRIRFWYRAPADIAGVCKAGEIGSFQQFGGTEYLRRTNAGKVTADDDTKKKSLTDAITKAASHIGVAGDIFMGRWDDSKYQDERAKDEAKEKRRIDAAVEAEERRDAGNEAAEIEEHALGCTDAEVLAELEQRATNLIPVLRKHTMRPEYERMMGALKAAGERLGKEAA